MREIKFRGKATSTIHDTGIFNGQWVYGYYNGKKAVMPTSLW